MTDSIKNNKSFYKAVMILVIPLALQNLEIPLKMPLRGIRKSILEQ